MLADAIRLLVFPALMAFAASSDLITMTISNRVSLALVATFFALALAWQMPLPEIGMHLGAGATVLVVAFACFAIGQVGGGDAKIATCVALWFGFGYVLEFLLYASLFGGALTLLLLQLRQWPLPVPLNGQAWLLKGVAIVNRSTNATPDIVLLSDPNRYAQYGNLPGQRTKHGERTPPSSVEPLRPFMPPFQRKLFGPLSQKKMTIVSSARFNSSSF